MEYLFINNENIDVCLPSYLRIKMTIWLKDKCQILTYHVNNTYAKLAPDSILDKEIKEIVCYTGGTPHILLYVASIATLLSVSASDRKHGRAILVCLDLLLD